jgi:hypothetical protein
MGSWEKVESLAMMDQSQDCIGRTAGGETSGVARRAAAGLAASAPKRTTVRTIRIQPRQDTTGLHRHSVREWPQKYIEGLLAGQADSGGPQWTARARQAPHATGSRT